jgi:hypothetical protein
MLTRTRLGVSAEAARWNGKRTKKKKGEKSVIDKIATKRKIDQQVAEY